MKKLLIILCIICCACDSDNAPDCLQSSGDVVTEVREVAVFDKIIVEQRVKLIIRQGNEQKVEVQSGENLMNEVFTRVSDGTLILENHNGCNLTRDYGLTTITVTSPNITEIRSSTGLTIESEGVLNYPSLRLLSENFQNDFHSSGDFYLNLSVQDLSITSNNLSNFFLEGSVENANLAWFSGDGQLFARELEIQNATIYHRGTNNWQIDVKQNITGTILGYGDVILETEPTNVNVNETWQGRFRIR